MGKDVKIFLGMIGFTFLLVVGLAFVQGREKGEPENFSDVLGLVAKTEYYDLGDVPINGGIVKKEYEVENNTDKVMKLKKIATSCMCTKASFEIEGKKTKFFGMEGHGDKNPPVNIEIAPQTQAKVIMQFDPAAHGPQGVGPFDRSVLLTFSDPKGVKELKFSGKVIN